MLVGDMRGECCLLVSYCVYLVYCSFHRVYTCGSINYRCCPFSIILCSPVLSFSTYTKVQHTAGVYSIRDVVLPLPGTRVHYPDHDTAHVYRTLAAQDGVDLQGPAGSDGQLTNAGGDYRHVVQAPLDFEYTVFRYDDDNVELASNDWEALEGGQSHEGVLAAAVREHGGLLGLRLRFQLPTSSYATMLLRELTKTSTAVEVHISRTRAAAAEKWQDDPELSE